MKFSVRPALNIVNGSDVSARADVRWDHNDNQITVRVSDTMFKDGLSTNGLSVGVKNDRFDVVYDVTNHAPTLRLNSSVQVNDKNVGLIYRRSIKANTSSLEASVDVDDSNTAALVYDLTNFDKPNHKSCTLKWTYRSGDIQVTPAYNLGTESLSVEGRYTVDSENNLKATYDMNSNMGTLEWVNSSGAGGGGDLRITARANLADADSAKQMPTLLVEKTWDMDV